MGVMKTRWRATLFKALEVETVFCSEVVLACAFMHNICITVGDTTEENILPEDPGPPEPQQHGDKWCPHQGQTGCPDFSTSSVANHAERPRLCSFVKCVIFLCSLFLCFTPLMECEFNQKEQT